MNTKNISSVVLITIVVLCNVATVFSATPDISFSGRITVSNGCKESVEMPVENATVRLYDDISCTIDGEASMISGNSGIDSTTSDATGVYSFSNVNQDLFNCYDIIVGVEAEGYYPQRRLIHSDEPSSLPITINNGTLNFELIPETEDSTIPVNVTVYAVDTTDLCDGNRYCDPRPLSNYSVYILDRFLTWFDPDTVYTTDQDGKATLPLSIVPYIDYTIFACAPGEDYSYRNRVTTNIVACQGNNPCIYVHSPETGVQPGQSTRELPAENAVTIHQEGGAVVVSISSDNNRLTTNTAVDIFNLTGRLVASVPSRSSLKTTSGSTSFSVNTRNIPAGMYLFSILSGNRSFRQNVLIRK